MTSDFIVDTDQEDIQLFKSITNRELATKLSGLRPLSALSGSTRKGFKIGGVTALFLLLAVLTVAGQWATPASAAGPPAVGGTPFVCDGKPYFLFGNVIKTSPINDFNNLTTVATLPGGVYNGLAYNPWDNYLYVYNAGTNQLYRVASNGAYAAYNPASGMSSYNGVFDATGAFVTVNAGTGRRFNVNTNPPTLLSTVLGAAVAPDAGLNPADGYIYYVGTEYGANNLLTRYDSTTGVGTTTSVLPVSGYAWGVFFTSNNTMIWSDSGLRWYQTNTTTGATVFLQNTAQSVDADACPAFYFAPTNTATRTPTNTPVPPTNTPTNTPAPPTTTPCAYGYNLSFAPAATYASGPSPFDIGAGDFDGDGILDLAVANYGGATTTILRGTGSGTFNAALTTPVNSGPHSVAVGDFNNDGKLDLAFNNFNAPHVTVLLNTSPGPGTVSFGPSTNYTVAAGQSGITVGHFNADSNLDIATTNYGSGTVSILPGTGSGSFGTATNYTVGGTPYKPVAGDFDGDGKLDLAMGVEGTTTVRVMLANGSGAFNPATTSQTGSDPRGIASGDFNADGILDLVTTNISGGTVSILRGNGNGTFAAPAHISVGGHHLRGVVVGDLNSDGTLDLAIGNFASSSVNVLMGSGSGTFGPAMSFPMPSSPSYLTKGDFNGDGKLDLATANYGSNNAGVLLNTSACAPPPTNTPTNTPSPTPSDITAPSITGSRNPTPNAAGWNNTNVTVSFACSDEIGGSGLQSCSTPTTLTAEGAGQSVTGTASDVAGNTNSAIVGPINIDKTNPTIGYTLSPAQPDGNNGWYKSNVIVTFTCGDQVGLSGVANCPGQHTFSQSGANQSYTATVFDLAGNSASVTVSGINIDKAAPTLSGAPIATPNAAGWHNGNVAVQWTCADQMGLSGVAGGCPSSSTITGEGTGLRANASVSDNAGNTTSATSVPAVNIDRSNPVTQASAPSGWQNGSVTVNLSTTDNLSNVKYTYYRLDGGAPTIGMAVTISNEGVHSLAFWSEDFAGNVEEQREIQVRVERSAPTIASRMPAPNANGWNKTVVTVTYVCNDTLSGVQSCTAVQTIGEGTNQTASGTAIDRAGNTAGTSVSGINVDLTPPTITGVALTAPNANGWYNGPVTIHFTCNDARSGIDPNGGCPADYTFMSNGPNQSYTGTATDRAGNTRSFMVSGINIDATAPVITVASGRRMLWPPNHQYVTLDVASFVTGLQDNLDNTLNANSITISSVSSDEPESTPGSGNTLNDIIISADGRSVQLRAEREGGGNGRVYTITVRITDRAGNTGYATYQAHVPPSMGNQNSIDDGPNNGYTVNRP